MRAPTTARMTTTVRYGQFAVKMVADINEEEKEDEEEQGGGQRRRAGEREGAGGRRGGGGRLFSAPLLQWREMRGLPAPPSEKCRATDSSSQRYHCILQRHGFRFPWCRLLENISIAKEMPETHAKGEGKAEEDDKEEKRRIGELRADQNNFKNRLN